MLMKAPQSLIDIDPVTLGRRRFLEVMETTQVHQAFRRFQETERMWQLLWQERTSYCALGAAYHALYPDRDINKINGLGRELEKHYRLTGQELKDIMYLNDECKWSFAQIAAHFRKIWGMPKA